MHRGLLVSICLAVHNVGKEGVFVQQLGILMDDLHGQDQVHRMSCVSVV